MAQNTKYGYRFLARVVVEAVTPIAIGAGERNVVSDALVVVDSNGLPYIPGSSLAGVMRHEWEMAHPEGLFGKHDAGDCWGSRVIVSDACLVGPEGRVMEGVQDVTSEFLQKYKQLPVRQHVRINHSGVTESTGKFDEQVVFKGSRFCFDLELLSENDESASFEALLDLLYRANFRIGGSTRHGLGQIRVVHCKTSYLNLSIPSDLERYLEYSSSLNSNFAGRDFDGNNSDNVDLLHYQLSLFPENFFLFGSGFGDADADMIPVREDYIVWDENGQPTFCEQSGLIPASSVKGALAHRLAYHWNRMQGVFADSCDFTVLTEENEAVVALLGSANPRSPKRGHVLFSDIFLQSSLSDKILNHVAIDSFTGGAADGMLFSEKVLDGKSRDMVLTLDVWVEEVALKEKNIKEAFECALRDLCSGRLPLGGGVNRGHGAFYGKLCLNGDCIFQYQ